MIHGITPRALALLLGAGVLACGPAAPASPPADDPAIWQLSTFARLNAGGFDGILTAGEVKRHGTLGLAAADQLNGEMALVDGRFYQFLASGQVVQAPDSMRLPFAEVTPWNGGRDVPVAPGQTFGADTASLLPPPADTTGFYAVRMEGTWDTIIVRTFRQQTPPYPTLGQAAANEVRDTLVGARGTLVGFWQPPFAQGMSIAGYHLHFVSEDRARGGHVLAFRARSARMQLSERRELTVRLPPAP